MSECSCFETMLEKVKECIASKLPEGATEFNANWEDSTLLLCGSDHVPVNPRIAYRYRAIKKDQTPAKNLTKDSLVIMCSYCPFCGRQINRK